MLEYDYFDYLGQRCEYMFLRNSSRLSTEDIKDLMVNVVEMIRLDEKERSVRRDDYEGKIYKEKGQLLGTFFGREFYIELDTVRGKETIGVLAREGQPVMPNYSKN